MKIRFIGTGSGMPDPERSCSSTLVEGPDGALLLDAGEGVSRGLSIKDLWYQQVRTIILTHAHIDHFGGLPMLLQGWYLEGRTQPLEIIMPGTLEALMANWLKTIRLSPGKFPFDLEFRKLSESGYSTASGHEISAFENGHLSTEEGGSYSIEVVLDGNKWFFSSDISNLDILEQKLPGIYGLIVESTHINPEIAVELSRNIGVNIIYLNHIPVDSPCKPITGACWTKDNMIIETL